MTYTAAQTEPLAQRLVSNLPGLDINLARAWITGESGANNNPLGVTASIGSGQPVGQMISATTYLVKFPTAQAGIDAAAALLKSPSMTWAYGGVTKAIATGTPTDQAKALIASPWNTPGSPYYTRIFKAAGLLGGTSTATPTVTNTSGSATGVITAQPGGLTDAVKGTVSWLIGYGAGSPGVRSNTATLGNAGLTQTMIDTITGDIPLDNPNRSTIISGLQSQIGQPVNTVKVPANWTDTPTGGWQNFWGGQAGTNGSGGGLGNSGIGAGQWWTNPTFILYAIGGLIMIVAGGFILLRQKSSPVSDAVPTVSDATPVTAVQVVKRG